MILATAYITGYWDTLPRIPTSSRIFVRFWSMRRYLSSIQSRKRWLLTDSYITYSIRPGSPTSANRSGPD